MSINTKHEVYQNLWNNADGLDVYYPDRFNREWYSDLIREEVIVRKNQNIVSTGTVSMDWSIYNMFTVAVPVNTTFNMINPRMNSDFIIVLVKDATGTARTLTWPGTWIWQSAPVTSLTVSGEEKAFRVSYLNGKYYITGYADGSGYLPLSGGTLTGPLVLPGNATQPLQAAAYGQVREKLAGLRNYYVRPDGNDNNDGKSNTPSGAFLTIQKAIDVVRYTIDLTSDVNINVADGTYTAASGVGVVSVGTPFTGPGQVYLIGNVANPQNCVISTTNAHAVYAANCSVINIRGFTFQTSGSGMGVWADTESIITLNGPCRFGACAQYHMYATNGAQVIVTSSYTVAGNAQFHMQAVAHGRVYTVGITVTFSGAITFSAHYAAAYRLGYVQANNLTFVGSFTGARYYAETNSVILVGGVGPNYFPGTVAGSTATGGQYV